MNHIRSIDSQEHQIKNEYLPERCPHFHSCSQNLCPLDPELEIRVGNNADKCRWMREAKRKKIQEREFISGGREMPTALLKFVPRSNVERLNTPSKLKWQKINNN